MVDFILDVCELLAERNNIIFNDQQRQGVWDVDKNTLLLAVPGSGKTTVMVARIANLIINHKIAPDEILTLTFSRESAKDMAARYESLFSDISEDLPKFYTIHSFCYGVLYRYCKRYNRSMPTLIESDKRNQIFIGINNRVNHCYIGEDVLEELSNTIGYIKNVCMDEVAIKKLECGVENIADIFRLYEQHKKDNGLMDYDDMLDHAFIILKRCGDILGYYQSKYRYINVDEAQDTSVLQHRIIKLLSSRCKIFMVGDEDQSIYRFRGAMAEELLGFNSRYSDPVILKLEQNYRSSKDIVSRANHFIKINSKRYDKEMYTDSKKKRGVVDLVLTDYKNQYTHIVKEIKNTPKGRSVGIIYRNNESGILVSRMLQQNKIPFYVKDHKVTLFRAATIRPVLAFMMFVNSPNDIKLFEQLYKRFKLSKGSFDIVKAKYKNYPTIIDCVLKEDGIEQSEVNHAVVVRDVLKRVKGKSPFKIIEAFEHELGYGGFLRWRIESGYSSANILQKLYILKEIASEHKTVDSFMAGIKAIESGLRGNIGMDTGCPVTITTIHSSKGLEYDTVIMVDMIDGVIPTEEAIDEGEDGNLDSMESEARLFYVAVTRARQKLLILRSNKVHGTAVKPSRFVTRFLALAKDKAAEDRSLQPAPQRGTEKPPEKPSLVGYKGKRMVHNNFGEGIVKKLEEDIATIKFKDHGVRCINLRYCLEQGLIGLKE